MSDVYICNWSGCLMEGKRKDMIWHVTMDHLEEERVPFYCTLCHYRARKKGMFYRHCSSYKPHRDLMADNQDKSEKDFLKETKNPYFIYLGTDVNACDALLKKSADTLDLEIRADSNEFSLIDEECQTEDTYQGYRELKAEMNVMKGTHQVELNKFADFISRKEIELRKREEEIKSLTRKLKERDDNIRVVERQNRHKDQEIETLRRKLRNNELEFTRRRSFNYSDEVDKENDEPPKKIKSVVKRLF